MKMLAKLCYRLHGRKAPVIVFLIVITDIRVFEIVPGITIQVF